MAPIADITYLFHVCIKIKQTYQPLLISRMKSIADKSYGNYARSEMKKTLDNFANLEMKSSLDNFEQPSGLCCIKLKQTYHPLLIKEIKQICDKRNGLCMDYQK